VSRSRSYVVGTQPASLKVIPKLPVSSGSIRRLGKDDDKGGDVAVEKTIQGQRPVIKVKVHIALDTFVAAAGLQAPISNRHKGQKASGIVFKSGGVEDTYQEVSKSLIPVVSNSLDLSHSSDIAYEYDFDSPERAERADRDLDLDTRINRNLDRDEESAQSPSGFSEFSHLTDHSDGYTNSKGNQKKDKDVQKRTAEADQRERIFHKLAPPLNTRQRFLVIISLLSDVARSIMVSPI
jgi:hypothetical protein